MSQARAIPAAGGSDIIAEASRRTEFEIRSCAVKRRYKIEPPLPNMNFRAYHCEVCGGWHLATKER